MEGDPTLTREQFDRRLLLRVARQGPVEDYSLDELTKIADVQGPPRKVEIRSRITAGR